MPLIIIELGENQYLENRSRTEFENGSPKISLDYSSQFLSRLTTQVQIYAFSGISSIVSACF